MPFDGVLLKVGKVGAVPEKSYEKVYDGSNINQLYLMTSLSRILARMVLDSFLLLFRGKSFIITHIGFLVIVYLLLRL